MSSAAKVGIFMLVILAILGFFILRIQRISVGGGPMKKVTAVFDSVAGLDKKSKVRIAGVEVGDVTDIRLRPDGKAEVTMEIDRNVELHNGAFARVVNMGLLGEKYVELVPGPVNAPAMPEQQALQGQVPASIDDVTNQISAIATDVKAITASLRATMGGPQGQERLQEIVENIRQITGEVRDLIAANRTNVDATLGNAREITASLRTEVPRIATSIEKLADSLNGTLGENRQDIHGVVENLRKLSADMRTTVDNLNAITGQVRSGEGTVGKLLYSDEAHQRLTQALSAVESGVNELRTTLGRANRITLDLGMKAEYQAGGATNQGQVGNPVGGHSRAAVMARIIPNPERNRFYNIELADDPRGKRVDKTDQYTITDPNTGQSQTFVVDETRFERGFRVS
ncbi:MAG TPA: MlaD family protein, partial [Thermoanaerobaculia bacterium]|nr:MlaD family protein [Thermoanaerobaculia bacterium]